MPEYIEVDQMWKCETCFHHQSRGCTLGAFGCDHGESYRPAYSKLKKADVAPVVHGRWDKNADDDNIVYCDQCLMPQDMPTNYRPNCGARMDGDG